MKRIASIIMIFSVMIVILAGCGSSTRSPEQTVRSFLKAAENDDMYTYYSCTEAGMYESKEQLREDFKDFSMKDFHEDMTSYFVWVSGNDYFNCDNGIKKIKIESIDCTENSEGNYDVIANVIITNSDGEDYDLTIKTDMWKGDTDETKGMYYLNY